MDYIHSSFETTEWEVNIDTISLAKALDELGVSLNAKDHAKCQPEFLSLKKKTLPVAWVVLNWMFDIIGTNEDLIFKYHASDKYQINPNEYTQEGMIKLIKQSFKLFSNEFVKHMNVSELSSAIPEMGELEYIALYQNLQRVMTSKGFEPLP